MRHIAIYPGSFDPITNGHIDIIERALNLFDQLIIAIMVNTRKTPWIQLEDRIALIGNTLTPSTKIQIISFEGLTVDCAKKYGAYTIVRGLRGPNDYDAELALAVMNRTLAPEIDTIFFPAAPVHAHVSATIVREIAILRGDVSSFVPSSVKEYLEQIINPYMT